MMKPRQEGIDLSRRAVLVLGASALGTKMSFGQNVMNQPVVLGQVYLSFYAVTGAVVQEVLERLGHTVEVREGPHEQIFPLLGQSVIDVMAAAWLPEGHATYWARYGTNAIEVAKLYDGAHFFLGVPDYVPEHEVSSIADLARPSVAAKMTKLIQGIGLGATITTDAQKAVADYGLDRLGYSLRPGTPEEWTSAYNRAVAERRWIVFPTWAPQYLNRGGRLRPLKDPRGVLGGMNHASLVAPRQRFAALPQRTQKVLSRIELSLDGVTEMDRVVNVEKKTPREAARTWMKSNEGRVSEWFRS
jgi:glycine betaine/proline transport system substrate-binding protein